MMSTRKKIAFLWNLCLCVAVGTRRSYVSASSSSSSNINPSSSSLSAGESKSWQNFTRKLRDTTGPKQKDESSFKKKGAKADEKKKKEIDPKTSTEISVLSIDLSSNATTQPHNKSSVSSQSQESEGVTSPPISSSAGEALTEQQKQQELKQQKPQQQQPQHRNETSTASTDAQQQQQQEAQNVTTTTSPSVIYYYMPRSTRPGYGLGSPGPFGTPGSTSPFTPSPNTPSPQLSPGLSLALSLLATTLRFILLAWMSGLLGGSPKHLSGAAAASSAYSPEPIQHFMFERVNDRYVRDAGALTKALSSPPPNSPSVRAWRRVWNKRRKEYLRNLTAAAASSPPGVPGVGGNKNGSHSKSGYGNVKPVVEGGRGGIGWMEKYNKTVILLDVHTRPDGTSKGGGGGATNTKGEPFVEYLRDAIAFLIEQYRDDDIRAGLGDDGLEVVLCLESGGGTVEEFGLAADQVARLRNLNGVSNGSRSRVNSDKDNESMNTNDKLTLTICVDRIAASGGYMIACQASPGQLFAAPFATVGSIGVYREQVNVHDILKGYGVRPIILRSGNAKLPITTYGEVTKEGMKIVQRDLDRVHGAFKQLVAESRGVDVLADIETVGTGEVFLGRDAREMGLVDRIITSDEYVSERLRAGDRVLRLQKYDRSMFGLKLSPLELLFLKEFKGSLHKVFVSSVSRLLPMVRAASIVGLLNLVQHTLGRSSAGRNV